MDPRSANGGGRMRLRYSRRKRRVRAVVKLLVLVSVLGAIGAAVAYAQIGGSTPPSGSIGPASGSSTKWTFDQIVGAASGGTIEGECVPAECSKYHLKVKLPEADKKFYANHLATLTFHCSWSEPQPTDADCFAFSPSGGETGPGKPDTSDARHHFEDIVVNTPASGTWTLEAQSGAPGPQPTTVTGVD